MYEVYGVIGYPARHSLSPVIHNLGFNLLGIRSVYGIFEVKPENLDEAIKGVKALGIKGLSVTVPYKETIIKYLAYVDEVALKIEAVNTIKNLEGALHGFNTDWIGIVKAFEENEIDLKNKEIVILGAGGASKAIVYGLITKDPKKIVVYNRTFEKALELAKKFQIEPRKWEEIEKASGDVIIQATSIGLNSWDTPVSLEIIKRFEIAMDIVYKPLKTKFLSLAEKAGCKTIDGLQMLIYQGIEQLRIWTELMIPKEVIEKIKKEVYKEAIKDEISND